MASDGPRDVVLRRYCVQIFFGKINDNIYVVERPKYRNAPQNVSALRHYQCIMEVIES